MTDKTLTPSAEADSLTVTRYRKKPVVIDAVQWNRPGDHPAVLPLVNPDPLDCELCCNPYSTHGRIGTLENRAHLVCPADWIITGVKGENYACKPDIFAATYEPEANRTVAAVSPHATPPVSLTLCDGKYEFYRDEITGSVMCKRYDKHWREFIGDKAVAALFDYAMARTLTPSAKADGKPSPTGLTYVIEKGSPALYFERFGYGSGEWTTDFQRACYGTKEQMQKLWAADEAMFTVLNDGCRITEHINCDGPEESVTAHKAAGPQAYHS